MWVLRYEAVHKPPNDQPPEQRLRVLVASRNLTFDTSWDTVVRLDEAPDAAGALLVPVGELFEGLLGSAVGMVSADHQNRVRSLSTALGTTKFALPEGVDDLQIHVLGLTITPSPLPSAAERSMIISPFVGDDFLTRVHPAPIDELVSSAESLDLLNSDALANVTEAYVFDDGSVPDLATAEDRLSPDDPGRPLAGLHAKVFAFEDQDQARLFLGSANATSAAFTSNVEVLVELAGSTGVLGIDQLCGGTDDEPGLRCLFNPYHRSDPPSDPSKASQVDHARCAIARLAVEGFVEESGSGSGWAVTYRSRQPMPVLDGTEIWCWPLASAGNRRRITGGKSLEERFETSLETISGFLAFKLSHDDGTQAGFVIPVPLAGVPECRDRFLLRVLIGNAERFLRYLLALLDEDSDQMDLLDTVEGVSAGTADGNRAFDLPVLEKLLRTMRRDPDKLAALHPLVSDLDADEALPSGFAELWMMVHDVARAGAEAR